MMKFRIIVCFLILTGLANVTTSQAQPIRERIRERVQQRMAQKAEKPSSGLHTMAYGGRERSYLIYLPKNYKPAQKAPLLLVLHGGGGNATGHVDITGDLNTYASQKGVIVVYPNGTGRFKNKLFTWNAGACCGYAMENNVDDVGFMRALVKKLEAEYSIDPNRIYVSGFSNGAMMTQRLGCEASNLVAGIAPVSGSLNITCNPSEPVPVMMFNGTADKHVLYNGGQGVEQADKKHPRADQPVSHAVSTWVKNNHCDAQPVHQKNGHIARDVYPNCDTSATVLLYTIEGGGHAWPGGNAYPWGDTPTKELSASKAMIDFFLAHPKSN